MKQILLTLTSLLFCAITFAQSVPQGINYQAVARDASGEVLSNDTLTIKFSVISDITTSAISWQETHTVTTNDYGLFSAVIGQGTGSQNTIDIINDNCTSSFGSALAADICANLTLGGYSDWFLPSKDELDEMYLNIGPGNAGGLGNIGGFANDTYWSSSQNDKFNAWDQNFSTANQFNSDKSNGNHVRAVRAF